MSNGETLANQANVTSGCLLVGEFVDESERPVNNAQPGEAVRTQIVANHVDLWAASDGLREFTILLREGPVVTVRGHALKHEPHPLAGEDVFGVVIRSAGEEVLVAVFKSADVAGVFDGDIRPDRRIA
jgi:hypothetical protein